MGQRDLGRGRWLSQSLALSPVFRALWETLVSDCGLPCDWGSQDAKLSRQSTCSLWESMKMLAVSYLLLGQPWLPRVLLEV